MLAKVECIYRPSLSRSLLRTMGLFFVSGYVLGSSFRRLAGSRSDYGQYLGSGLCVLGAGMQLARSAFCAVWNK